MNRIVASAVLTLSVVVADDWCSSSVHGYDCYGNDISKVSGITQHQDCCNSCIALSGCNAWTWHWPTSVCYLKSSCSNNVSSSDDCHSSRPRSPTPTPSPTPSPPTPTPPSPTPPTPTPPTPTPPSPTPGSLGSECQNYLSAKGLSSVDALDQAMRNQGGSTMPCAESASLQQQYHPNPQPGSAGGSSTEDMSCRYGNPALDNTNKGGVCCGMKPHFNWIVATCENAGGGGEGQFCASIPDCAKTGSPKINYVASYQFDGTEFVLMDESTVGEISADGVSGSYSAGTGWEAHKQDFKWKGGDWTTKYAPWARGANGAAGPRGVTPPAGMWVLSAENFYYGGFYMLPQLTLNLEGNNNPTGTNCWTWELDPVEGTVGWKPGDNAPGNLNDLYTTDNAQISECMPLPYAASQTQGARKNFSYPEEFRSYCASNPTATGCQPWAAGQDVSWSGGSGGTQRFENYWDEPYVFAVVVDAKGYWTYRWRPDSSTGTTGWSGVSRHTAARKIPAKPTAVKAAGGLATDVRGDATEAVIMQPSLSDENACLRSSIEAQDWNFGSSALGAMASELGENSKGQKYEGAHNWWTKFADTGQWEGANYPLSIAGVPSFNMAYTCNNEDTFSCSCKLPPKAQDDMIFV